jgi:hypothetical protein
VSEIIPEVVSRQAEEAVFRQPLCDAAIGQLCTLHLPIWPNSMGRVEAYLDGLTIVGDEGWEILKRKR